MRERHVPRLCGSCRAPMARQEDACWRCGARWAPEAAPRTTLRVIDGGRVGPEPSTPRRAVAAR
jgi:predicted amidophosphoribosyltransferase